MANVDIDELSINTIRLLSADAVQKANSGHPGLPMGAAAFSYALWMNHLRFNPVDPNWLNRDRFVLSAGHGSMLLYSLLHLTGYELPLDEIKKFRQWKSLTPGHPEHGLTPGVETTTGPLGQGFANAIGMALAERFLATRYNKPAFPLFDYHIYALVSDGDMMEGITSEAASYAGSLQLGKLIYMYDSNGISIEGSTKLTFCENTIDRFKAYGWHTQLVNDGNSVSEVNSAITKAKIDPRPSLIVLKTHIGFGSPNKQDTSSAHGSPIGEDELIETKRALGWPVDKTFYIPPEVKEHMAKPSVHGKILEQNWITLLAEYKSIYPDLHNEIQLMLNDKQSIHYKVPLDSIALPSEDSATREISGIVMNALAENIPLFVGGSADLAPSNNTHLKNFGEIIPETNDPNGRNLHFGIREHAMGGILNGLALSDGVVPFGGTFLCFSDYMKAPIRLAAIMKLGVIYVFTHDSIGQGEDGTTHQPIEHLAALRAMPGITVIRPADGAETVGAWDYAIQNRLQPTALVLTRQKVPNLHSQNATIEKNVAKGGYILKDSEQKPTLILLATGSEVQLALKASDELTQKGLHVRVVSMPSMELFEQQSAEYQVTILPNDVNNRISIEAASTFGWQKFVGSKGTCIGIDHFGSSAPGKILLEEYGFTVGKIIEAASNLMERDK